MIDNSNIVRRGRIILNVLLHQIIAVIGLFSIWNALLNYNSQLSWHIILCSLGLFPFMAQAAIIKVPENVYTNGMSEESKRKSHFIINGISVAFIIGGIAVEIVRQENGGTHFGTSHGIMGLIVLLLIIAVLATGVVGKILDLATSGAASVILLIVHNILGILSYVFTVVALITGYYTPFYFAGEEAKITASFFSVFVCLWSVGYACVSTFNQIREII